MLQELDVVIRNAYCLENMFRFCIHALTTIYAPACAVHYLDCQAVTRDIIGLGIAKDSVIYIFPKRVSFQFCYVNPTFFHFFLIFRHLKTSVYIAVELYKTFKVAKVNMVKRILINHTCLKKIFRWIFVHTLNCTLIYKINFARIYTYSST